MAGDQDDSQKTEEPTEKRLADALKKGDVAKSQEINTLAVLAMATALLASMAGWLASLLSTPLYGLMERVHTIPLDGPVARSLFGQVGGAVLVVLAAPFAAFILAGLIGNLVQHPPLLAGDKVKPDLKKISPLSGAKRMFGLQGWVNLGKGIVKILVIGAIIVAVLWPESDKLLMLIDKEPGQILEIMQTLLLRILMAACAALLVLAVADFTYQKYERHKRLRMSKQDVKDEFKQAEGDPHVKGKLKALRQERSRQRMMAAVPEATVVVANPTHFAVALKYESDTMEAPLCVAKGVDSVALRIRQLAEEHGVAVVENPPLARALHGSVEIDHPIPPEHYKAVAQVIGYVWRLRQKAGKRR